ncbi:hypothetical protein F444_19566 [Phytophthora nicotianae P1976]|uniref:Uncharacterized protein n=1 Tax=Phytophthora nicotianae P1976 TaxID=1317066 RepID=A0A080Z7C8_PHYNI|nr:hypothetical protein F444_19566 [Phytophthora nicotianae P1976]
MITGDRYSNCEPHLATYCCKCENDNLAIFFHKCRDCEIEAEKSYYLDPIRMSITIKKSY